MKRTYFASDFHLGVDARLSSREREKQLVRWLEHIRKDAEAIYLLGDVFDFWFEYRTVVPKGFVRLLGKLAELRDQGIPIYFFTGNHDMWMFRYFEEELGIPIWRKPRLVEIGDKKFYLGHGDGLGPGDHGYKFIKRVFASPWAQWLYARLHPNFALPFARYWSNNSRASHGEADKRFLGEDGEWLIAYVREKMHDIPADYFVFGHRHLPIDFPLDAEGRRRYINLGEWLYSNSYAVFDGRELRLQFFENEEGRVFP